MAIIQCPECGAQISSSAKNCIHCGCEFKVCEECGNVIVGNPESCPSCGLTFVKKAEKPSAEDLTPVVQKWESESFFQKFLKTNALQMISFIASAALLIIGIIGIFTWKNSDALEALMEAENVLSERKTMFVFSGILFVLSSFFLQFNVYWRSSSFQLWAYKHELNIISHLKKELEFDFTTITASEISDRYDDTIVLIKAEKYKQNPKAKNYEKAIAVFAILASAVSAILMTVFLINNTENYMESVIIDGDFKLEGILLLILSVVIYIGKTIITHALEKKVEQADDDLIKNELPENYEAYSRYVKRAYDIYFDSLSKS